MGWIERLKLALAQIFSEKARAEAEAKRLAKGGEEARRKRAQYETEKEREEAQRKQKEKEKLRAYHEAGSAEVIEMEAEMARTQRKAKVKERLAETARSNEHDLAGSDYLTRIIRADGDVQEALNELIDESSAGAEAVYTLLTKGAEIHGSAISLIKYAQRLTFEAEKAGVRPQLKDLFGAISNRAQDLLQEEYGMAQKLAHAQRQPGYRNAYEFLHQESDIVMSGEKDNLSKAVSDTKGDVDEEQTWNRWKGAVDRLVQEPRPEKPDASMRTQWVKDSDTSSSQMVAGHVVSSIDRIWSELERKEATAEVTVDDLFHAQREIREEEARFIPKDVPPGSDAYNRAVRTLNEYTDNKYNELVRKLKEKLRNEKPVVRQGIINEDDFLIEMANNKGHMGHLLELHPEMYKRFIGIEPECRRFRDRVFLTIHSGILNDQRQSSDKNFNLYEMADFSTFNDLLRLTMGKLTVKATGRSLGETLTEHYINLSNTIRQCRDIDFWASQPGATSENFSKSLGMFQNEYVKEAFNIPAVNAAFRTYEETLRSIMASNDGYIPPALIEYNPTEGASFWDNWSQRMLEQKISMGSVPDVMRDGHFGLTITDEDGHSVMMDMKNPLKMDTLSKEEIKMYMTLAKGMGMAWGRFPEIFATQRVPGSDNPSMGAEGFHSVPYEGVAKALNYFNLYIEKWKIGSFTYFHLLNQLIPDEKNKITVDENDSTSAYRAFMAYQDGTFEEKYGKEAKRFVDMTNFSGISSGVGKDTLWRQYDMTYKWSDKHRELLGGPTRLALSSRFAGEKVKDFLVVSKYQEEYRQEIIKQNQQQPGLNRPTSGAGFDKLWEEYGKTKYQSRINIEWDKLNGKDPAKGIQHTPLAEKTDHLVDAYKKALKARIWVEMAMRNPLVVAHSLKVDLPLVGIEGKKKMKLHNLLVQDILGIPPEDTKYGEKWGRAVDKSSPSREQQRYMTNVLSFEGDLAAVREWAINESRDLTEDDFVKVIKDKARLGHALQYWKKVRQIILGTDNTAAAKDLYERFGLKVINGEDYAWDYGKIHDTSDRKDGISATLHHITEHGQKVQLRTQDGKSFTVDNMIAEAVKMEPEWILGTDDMAFNRLDILNLGSRQLLRRGGDIAAHEAGGQGVAKYLMDGIVPTPDKNDLAKMLKEIRNAYLGDQIEAGWQVVGNLAYMTDRLFAWDWNRLGSSAQLDVWGTRRGVAAWMANGRREFWDAIEHQNVLPPHGHFYYYNTNVRGEKTDIHTLRKLAHADNSDVWKEIIMLGMLVALAMTVYRALTAPSEEEEGGGGGHH